MRVTLAATVRLAVLAAIFIFFGFAWWVSHQADLYQSQYGDEIRSKFGFSSGSPYIIAGDDKVEVFSVYPEAGGLLHRAGFRDADIIVSETITGFYKLLYHSSGKRVSVDVVKGGDGPPVNEREVMNYSFDVP